MFTYILAHMYTDMHMYTRIDCMVLHQPFYKKRTVDDLFANIKHEQMLAFLSMGLIHLK